ncbi:hypothetical protein [Streptomyces sp. NPDC059909]|uniref:hypothetical protein n=1 Tax=Streptomyces sp. NPDC059909 TaxID=3346998 RepID=UPI0036467CE6
MLSLNEAVDADGPFIGPIHKVLIVPKDGSAPHFAPTHFTPEQFRDYLDRGEWLPRKA